MAHRLPVYAGVAALVVATLTYLRAPAMLASFNPVELGHVTWGRDLDAAKQAAASSRKPIFLQFQEIPGCQGCKDFGADVLSHPLLIEAIETEFIPVAIPNNTTGDADARVRDRYGEPSWNYPVTRFIGADGRDLIPRQDQVYRPDEMAARMIAALEAAGRPAPDYLRLVAAEATGKREKATFAMACYWEGEARLGALEGVLETRAGWLEGQEVVEVTYDPSIVPFATLVTRAGEVRCASAAYAHSDSQVAAGAPGVRRLPGPVRDANPADQLHDLGRSPLRFLPLTPMQATRVNASLHRSEDPARWLSPRQTALAARIGAALERDPKALDGLSRPRSPDRLIGYADTLNGALAKALPR